MKRKLFISSLIWALLILAVCAIPGDSLPERPFLNIPHFDKIMHVMLYLPWAFLLAGRFSLLNDVRLRKAGPLLVMFIVFMYGGLIELMQQYLFKNRSGNRHDLLADLAGALVGIMCYYLFSIIIKRRLKVFQS